MFNSGRVTWSGASGFQKIISSFSWLVHIDQYIQPHIFIGSKIRVSWDSVYWWFFSTVIEGNYCILIILVMLSIAIFPRAIK